MQSLRRRPVSPMYCFVHTGQIIQYTMLIDEHVMCPIILYDFFVDVEVISIDSIMFSYILQENFIHALVPLLTEGLGKVEFVSKSLRFGRRR